MENMGLRRRTVCEYSHFIRTGDVRRLLRCRGEAVTSGARDGETTTAGPTGRRKGVPARPCGSLGEVAALIVESRSAIAINMKCSNATAMTVISAISEIAMKIATAGTATIARIVSIANDTIAVVTAAAVGHLNGTGKGAYPCRHRHPK